MCEKILYTNAELDSTIYTNVKLDSTIYEAFV